MQDRKITNREANDGEYFGDMELAQELVQEAKLSYLPIIGIEEVLNKTPQPMIPYNHRITLNLIEEITKNDYVVDISFWDKGLMIIRKINQTLPILYKIIKLYFIIENTLNKIKGELKMNPDKVTTITGIIKGVLYVAGAVVVMFFGVPQDQVDTVSNDIMGIILGIIGVVNVIQGWFTNKKQEAGK